VAFVRSRDGSLVVTVMN